MLQEALVEAGNLFAGGAVYEYGVEDIHLEDAVAQLFGAARVCCFQLLSIVGKVEPFAIEDGILGTGDAHDVELES